MAKAKNGNKKASSGLMAIAPKAVVHLRAQHHRKRLGLIFGSGASKDLGFPDWSELVERIAADPDVDAGALMERIKVSEASDKGQISKSLASLTHMLFSHFRDTRIAAGGLSGSINLLEEQRIKSDWLKIIHKQLYKDIDHRKRRRLIESHPYLTSFREIIKQSPLTVNYNFDDTVEQMLMHARSGDELLKTKGYEVTDRPNAQFQKDNSVVYHPNGFLPALFEDGSSTEVVFSDDAFQDQLINAATGKYLHLSNHLFRNTCILIGLSLEDTTLQSLLRQSAVTNPGHIHYIVHFLPKGANTDDETRRTIFRANFSSYNLYTLFLDANGIKNLAELILMDEDTFKLNNTESCRKFVYYLVGSIGAGKSTAASNFRNLITYDEWVDERLPKLAVPEKEVKSSEVEDIDKWVADQFTKKNMSLDKHQEGIHIIDRCPLDPLTFGPPTNRSTKAASLISSMKCGTNYAIQPGHVIYLDCDVSELRIRNSFKHKYWDDDSVKALIGSLDEVYGGVQKSVVSTLGRSAADVAKEIARIIYLDDYAPVDIEAELLKFAEVPAS